MLLVIQFFGTNAYMETLINLVFKIACLVLGKITTSNLMGIGISHSKNQTTTFLISQGDNIS